MLATGSLVGAATAARVGSRCAVTVARRTPPLIPVAVRASTRDGSFEQSVFRDELIALARETAEVSWRELRRGLEEFDLRTRPAEAPAPRPYRPTRVKP